MSEQQPKADVILTTAAMPHITVGEIDYPLFFAAASIKAWAEHKGVTFKEAVSSGWEATELDEADLRFLLMEAMKSAETRRQAFSPGPPRAVADALIDQVFLLTHVSEIWTKLLQAWNAPPAQVPVEGSQDPTPAPSGGTPSLG